MRRFDTKLHRWATTTALMVLVTFAALPAESASAQGLSAHQSGLAPTVSNVHVDVASSTTVTVVATVNPEGSPTTIVVTYGANGALIERTPVLGVGAGTTPQSVNIPVRGLSPGVTYAAQLEATNAVGVTPSSQVPFSTSSASGTGPSGPGGAVSSSLVSRLPVAGPPGSPDGLSGVSCWSSGCWAVGVQGASPSSDRPLVERWTGRGFVAAAAPPGAGAALYSVSCPGPEGCVAVGRAAPNVYAAEVVHGRWREIPAPSPRTANGDILTAVSCVSLHYCWAVGYTDGASTGMSTLFELWNGRTWRVAATPPARTSMLNAVSCTSQSDCWAAGGSNAFPQLGSPLLEHWNGHSWTITNLTQPSLRPGQIDTVGCRGASSCWAVVATTRTNQVVHDVNGSWAIVPSGVVMREPGVNAMTCASAATCWFVGNEMSVALWSPSGWTPAQLLWTVGGGLRAVSCLASGECVAVGLSMNYHTDATASMRATAYLLRTT